MKELLYWQILGVLWFAFPYKLSLSYYFLSQWCHSNFQTQAKKLLIPYLWSAATSGGFLQLLNKHQLGQSLQTSLGPVKLWPLSRCRQSASTAQVHQNKATWLCGRPSPTSHLVCWRVSPGVNLQKGENIIIVGISLQKWSLACGNGRGGAQLPQDGAAWAAQCPDHVQNRPFLFLWCPLSPREWHQPFGSFLSIFPIFFLLITLKILRECAISKPSCGGSPHGAHHADMWCDWSHKVLFCSCHCG